MAIRVSIVITSYNYARYVGQTIDSALAQTYPDVEVIVVDDGSTDSSPEIIRGYGDRVKPLFRANGGQAAAQNAGFAASSGDIVLILDSDDYLYPDAIASVIEVWRPNTTKAQFYLDAVDGAGAALGFRLPNIPMDERGAMRLIECYGYYPSPPTSGNAYARSFLERVLPMCQTTWKRGPDGLLNALAALYGDIVSIPCALGAYRIHGRNMYAGAIDVALLRANMQNELDREVEIKMHSRRLGRPIGRELCLAIPAHCKARLVALKLDRARQKPIEDSALRLAWAGIRASWRFPHLSLTKRLLATAVFPLLAVAPVSILQDLLEPLFRDTKRDVRGALRSVLRRLAALESTDQPLSSASSVSDR